MAEPTHDSLFREIDEELRQENLAKLWKKYGNFLIAGALALVIGVAGFQAWRQYDRSTRLEQGAEFAAATSLAESGDLEGARKAFDQFADQARPGYALLARFREADILASTGKTDEALAIYGEIAGDTSADTLYRDLATVYGVLHRMNGGDPNELTAELAPIMADDNPWRHTARELTATLAVKAGSREQALEMFGQLAEDPSAPQGIVERAKEMLAALGADAG